jgi:hypothetical protein
VTSSDWVYERDPLDMFGKQCKYWWLLNEILSPHFLQWYDRVIPHS